jgi:hypothetical protein
MEALASEAAAAGTETREHNTHIHQRGEGEWGVFTDESNALRVDPEQYFALIDLEIVKPYREAPRAYHVVSLLEHVHGYELCF